MKKDTIIITSFIFMCFFVPLLAIITDDSDENTSSDYAKITNVDYTAEVVDEPGSNGKVIITERLTYDIHASSKDNLYWELWRDLPEKYVDGVKVEYKVNSVKQIKKNGREIIYEESPKLYWNDNDYINTAAGYGPEKWYHSEGPYNEDKRQYECVLFYVDGLYREKVTFEIEYEMYNAALRYNDCSELYLTPYSESTIKYLKSFKGQILIPDNKMPNKGNYFAHTYGTNSHTFPFKESDTKNPGYHTFSFNLKESDLKFKPYNQYIEFTLVSYGDDKHAFTKYASKNNYYYDDVLDEIEEEQEKYDAMPEKYRKAKIIILIIFSTSGILIIIGALKKEKKIKKKYKFFEPTTQIQYFRDIPSNLDPIFASALVFCKDKKQKKNKEEYAAIMLSLVRKGYIELVKIKNEKDWTTDNIKIIIKYITPQTSNTNSTSNLLNANESQNEAQTQALEPLTQTENYYFNLINRHSKNEEITLEVFQNRIAKDYENTNTFVNNIQNSIPSIGTSQKYFQTSDYKKVKNEIKSTALLQIIIGILIMIFVNIITYQTRLDLAFGSFFILGSSLIISAIHLNKISGKYILLTQYGEDEYAKWRGLYNFLNSETLMKERTVIELPIWEQYLVYATAFGISEKVIKALKIRCPESNNSPILSNPYYRSRGFYIHSHAFRTATSHASYTARSGGYSMGYGGHGGYGGGGRGGGGGRRRTLKNVFSNKIVINSLKIIL